MAPIFTQCCINQPCWTIVCYHNVLVYIHVFLNGHHLIPRCNDATRNTSPPISSVICEISRSSSLPKPMFQLRGVICHFWSKNFAQSMWDPSLSALDNVVWLFVLLQVVLVKWLQSWKHGASWASDFHFQPYSPPTFPLHLVIPKNTSPYPQPPTILPWLLARS